MTGDQDAGILAHADVYRGNLRIAVGSGVGGVQHRHALHAVLTRFQGQGHQLVRRQAVVQRFGQGALDKGIYVLIVP